MNILLMANWGIGLEVLKALHLNPQINDITVVTRHHQNSKDPWKNIVYDYSTQFGYKTLREQEVTFEKISTMIKDGKIDLLITHAYMKIIPELIFNAPPKGSINIHPSLLPKYRGPSPTQWVLKNREVETGLTCHYIDQGIDTGDIIHQIKNPVIRLDTIETIIEKEKKQVKTLMDNSIAKIQDPFFIPRKQIETFASYAPKIINTKTVGI